MYNIRRQMIPMKVNIRLIEKNTLNATTLIKIYNFLRNYESFF